MIPKKLISRKEVCSGNHGYTDNLHIGYNTFKLNNPTYFDVDPYLRETGYIILLFDDKMPDTERTYNFSRVITNLIGSQIYGITPSSFVEILHTKHYFFVKTEEDFLNRLLSTKVPIITEIDMLYQIMDSIIVEVFL